MKPVNISLDHDAFEGAKDLPRRVSISSLVRHMIKANGYDEKQWAEYKKTAEAQECLEFLRPLRERLAKR
jgi:post-segregation antitoxin (ccd killing protein)